MTPLRAVCALGSLLAMLSPAVAGADAPAHASAGRTKPGAKAALSVERPHVSLWIEPADSGWTWLLRVQNDDVVPLRVVGDARLLSLDINPPLPKGGPATTIDCTLPAEMRPSSDDENVQIVPPGLSYVETFDPRLYCFEAQRARALTPGATVVARFGFATSRGRSQAPPFAVAAADDDSGKGGWKELVSKPFAVPSPSDDADEDAPAAHADRLVVAAPSRIDATTFRDITIPITVSNPTPRSVTLLLRPETIAIDATGPYGTTRCQWVVAPTPIAELFTTLPPRGHATTEVLLSSICPASFFQKAGLYSLRTAIDTRRASGEPIGLHTFDGEATSPKATLLRLRTSHHLERRSP